LPKAIWLEQFFLKDFGCFLKHPISVIIYLFNCRIEVGWCFLATSNNVLILCNTNNTINSIVKIT